MFPLFKHIFLSGDLTKKIGKDLLDLYTNGPSNSNAFLAQEEDDDEPDVEVKAPKRISNKKPNSSNNQVAETNNNKSPPPVDSAPILSPQMSNLKIENLNDNLR